MRAKSSTGWALSKCLECALTSWWPQRDILKHFPYLQNLAQQKTWWGSRVKVLFELDKCLGKASKIHKFWSKIIPCPYNAKYQYKSKIIHSIWVMTCHDSRMGSICFWCSWGLGYLSLKEIKVFWSNNRSLSLLLSDYIHSHGLILSAGTLASTLSETLS